jgi:hypothetical protein
VLQSIQAKPFIAKSSVCSQCPKNPSVFAKTQYTQRKHHEHCN